MAVIGSRLFLVLSVVIGLFFGLTAASKTIHAQTISEVRALSFGLLVIPDNDTISTVTQPRSGTTTDTGPVIPLTNGEPGRYLITGLPATTAVTLSFSASPVYRSGAGGGSIYFTLGSFDPTPSLVTNGSGQVTFELGATLSTSGNGTLYPDDSYEGDLTVTIVSP